MMITKTTKMTKKTTLILIAMFVSLFATHAQVNETQRLISNDIDVEDYFGNGVAVSGDYAIIGACYDDANGINSGSAYIFSIMPAPGNNSKSL